MIKNVFKESNLYKRFFTTGIRRTFVIFMLIATLLPLSIGGVTSYIISKQTIQEEVTDFNEAWIAKQTDYLELLLQEIEGLMENIANLDSIKNSLSDQASTMDNYTNLSTQATIGYILSGYNIKGLVSIDLLSMNGDSYHVGDTLNFQKINIDTKNKLYDLALKSDKSIAWAGLENNINENSTNNKVISAVKLIKRIDKETLKEIPVGLLIVNYSVDVFSEHFTNSNLNENSTLMIVDNERDILFHTDKTNIGARADATFIGRLIGDSGAFIESLGGQEMFVVYSSSKLYGWKVLSYIPVKKLTENANPIIFYTLGVALLCLILISGYAINLSRKVLTPINEITVMFKEIGDNKADLNTRLTVKSHDEIGELVKWFNVFLDNLSDKQIVEDKLMIAYEGLEQRVKERTIELEDLNAVLNNRTKEIQEALEKLKATQNQLIQREKLAGIGQLAAGIAHEINNPLGFVSSNMSSLQRYLDSLKKLLNMYQTLGNELGSLDKEHIKIMLDDIVKYETENSVNYVLEDLDELFVDVNTGLERVGKIVKSLRMFTWMDKEAVYEEEYDLRRGIENSLIMAQNEIKYVAEVEQNLGDIPLIVAIGNEINQVLLNFIVNAAHAIKMKESEILGLIKIGTYHDEGFVYCSIEDNGVGISEENLKQIFNPFFTTKAVGDGTGLGLSISYDIVVNQHHGEILAESEIGLGTKFIIKLPIQQNV
jgi:signal transduction histidine kinase